MKRRAPEWLAWAAGLALAPAFAQDQAAAPSAVAAAVPAVAAMAPATSAAAPAAGNNSTVKGQLTRLPSAADMRPTGPVSVTANRAEVIQGNTAVYTGNVHYDSNTLKLDGDRLEVKRAADGQYEAKMTGTPAHMFHAGVGPDNPEVTAHSKTMTYDSRTGMLDLVGESLVTRGKDEIHGETIRYNVVDNSMDVDSGGKGQVSITLQPPPPAPAPSAPAGSGIGATPSPAASSPSPAAPPSTPPAEEAKP